MIAVAFVLATVNLAALGCVVWLVRLSRADQQEAAEEREDRLVTEARLTRTVFELDATNVALADRDRRITALEAIAREHIQGSPLGAGLADDDVAGRLLRLSEASSPGRPLSADPRDGLLDPAAAE